MFYNPKQKSNNRFRAVSLPSTKKLFDMYGYSRSAVGHPDNTDPYKFSSPSNPQGMIPNEAYMRTLVSGVSSAFQPTEQQPSSPESKEVEKNNKTD